MAKAKPQQSPSIDLEDDAQKPAPTDKQLKEITALVATMIKLQKDYDAGQELLKQVGAKIERMSSTDIPEAMKAVGLTLFKMTDGKVIEINEADYGSYTKDNEPAVFKFLRKSGHGDIIKSALAVAIGKGKEHLVAKLQKVLGQKAYEGCVVEFKETIHPSTFKAFVREQLEEGKPLPKQIAIFHKSETIVKEPKNGSTKKAATSSKADRF
jgi:hypothetical protein